MLVSLVRADTGNHIDLMVKSLFYGTAGGYARNDVDVYDLCCCWLLWARKLLCSDINDCRLITENKRHAGFCVVTPLPLQELFRQEAIKESL